MEPTPDPAPVHFINTPGSDPMPSQSAGDWITVSETIVADTMKLQIKRIRLLRRRRNTDDSSAPTTATTVTPGAKFQEEEQDEESWEEEVLLDVDDTLATAIEKVVGVVPRSPGSPVQSDQDEHEGAGAGCRAAVLGALTKVIRQVVKGESQAQDNVLTDGVKRWLWGAQEAF